MTASARDLPTSIADLLPRIHVLRLPMVTRFRGITEREVMLIEGPDGWAEFSPRDRNALAEMVQFAHLGAANPILGPVIFTGGVDGAGETRGLSEERARQIERLAVVLREAV